ncbi:MAG: hypothetical protein DRP89_07890 [Candidatus Neomarinimicrobiota bacterium]|nr:MAG: hypothetical protein DRP89_07890 [Candidatus Neomarinimicrobiota bacterium]
MEISVEVRRVAIEIIATLVHIKSTMSELILKPAGVSLEVYQPLLYRRDENTGKTLSKRQIAPLILDAIENRDDCIGVIRRMIEIASHWSSFHLANDEFQARATVQKARELLGTIELMEAREAKQRELARKEELARMERERAEILRKQSELLLMMFDDLAVSTEEQRRGYLLQDLLNRTFALHEIPVVASFTRNEGSEQIDGAFKLEGWHYIVECRWRKKLSNIRELDGLSGQIARSGRQTMGVFLSINGWSDNVVPLLKQNPDKGIILMDGYDFRTVLAGQVDLRDFLLAKVAKLNLETEPYYSVAKYMNEQTG